MHCIFPTSLSLPTQKGISLYISRALRQVTMWPFLDTLFLSFQIFPVLLRPLITALYSLLISYLVPQVLWEALSTCTPWILPECSPLASTQVAHSLNSSPGRPPAVLIHTWEPLLPQSKHKGPPDPTGAELRSLTYIPTHTPLQPS